MSLRFKNVIVNISVEYIEIMNKLSQLLMLVSFESFDLAEVPYDYSGPSF